MTTTDTDDTEYEPVFTFADIEARQRQAELGVSQRQTLNLRPWQVPTCSFFYEEERIDEILAAGRKPTETDTYKIAVLAKKLRDAGLSLYEPDPERALNDPEYREVIDARVRKLEAENKKGLTDKTIETVMSLAPYGVSEEAGPESFRMLLGEKCPGPVTFDACFEVMRVLHSRHRERTRAYDDDGKLIRR